MSDIGRYAIPPEGTFARQAFDNWIRDNPLSSLNQKEIKSRFKQAIAIILAQVENGADFPIDNHIRYFLREYNNRNFSYGLRSMPSSFNILEAFFSYNFYYNYFRLRGEIDHLMSFVDFLDYFTSKNVTEDTKDALNYMKEGIIYSYNAINNVNDITFSMDNGAEYGIAGVSLVRFQSEINIFLLGGEKTNLDSKSKEIQEGFETMSTAPGREKIKPADDRRREAVPLINNRSFWQTIVLSRFDLEDMTQNSRYILRDWEDFFQTITDDTEAYLDHATGKFIDSQYESMLKKSCEEIGQHKTLFELCKTVIHLPLYFESHSEFVIDERHPTKLAKTINTGKWLIRKKLLGPNERITYRQVSVLRDTLREHPTNTFYNAPPFNIETLGYWKKLDINQIGGDKHGNPIHGRTWVKKTLSWLQSDRGPGVIRAKRDKNNDKQYVTLNNGYIYVMTSAAHDKDIFKIGLTRKSTEIRSGELSRTTGSPDKFLVVQEWEVSDCVKAEKLIHRELSQYRINPNREFFQAPYKVIVDVINSVIYQLESE
jgi:hypothetical protein